MKKRIGVAVGLMLFAGVGQAERLIDVFEIATQEDPQYAAALNELKAQRTLAKQARGVLLPTIGATGGYNYVWQDIQTTPIPFGFSTIDNSGKTDDPAWSYGVQLRQPLFNLEAFSRYQQANAAIAGAELRYLLAGQELALRVSQAYFGVLLAQRQWQSAMAEKNAIEQQLNRAKRGFQVGTAAITDVDEAQAAYDATTAQELALRNQVAIAQSQLAAIVGRPMKQLTGLGTTLPLEGPSPESIDAWMSKAREGNLMRLAQEQGVLIAKEEVDSRKARHWPTLNMVGAHTYDQKTQISFSGNTTEVEAAIDTIGLQLSVPLYSGGLLSAQVEEAAYRHDQAKNQLVGATRQAEFQASQAYLQLTNNIARVIALMQTLKSSQTAMQSTQVGRDVGVRTQVDVLTALQNLYRAERDLDGARYNYLLARLQLQAAVGALTINDVKSVSGMLTETVEPGVLVR